MPSVDRAPNNSTRNWFGILALLTLALAGGSTAYVAHAIALPSLQEATARTAAEGVFNEEQTTRADAVYKENCTVCHLDDLSGSDQAPPLAGAEFLSKWEGQTTHDLMERIRTSMPLGNPGSLSTATSTDLVAFILKANGFPGGTEELKPEALKAVLIKKS